MDKTPEISVIMSTYNETNKWLSQAIESIVNQSFKDFEFIIVLDNPNNQELEKLILKYKNQDSRIIFLKNEKNLGLIKSLNKALQYCKGKYIARMDADDIAYLERFEKQINFLDENLNIDLLGTAVTIIDEEDKILEKCTSVAKNPKGIKEYLKYTNVVTHPTIMFRRSILSEGVENYRNIPYAEDYDFMCRVVGTGHNITNLEEPLLKYRHRESSISREKFLAQLYNAFYLKKLYLERINTGRDSYNEENLYREGVISVSEVKRFNKSENIKRKALNYKISGNRFAYVINIIFCKVISKYAFKNAMCTIKYKKMCKKLESNKD